MQLGTEITKGRGTENNLEIGRQAAQEDRKRIAQAINGVDILFLTGGMGGGTAAGAMPVIASIAKDLDVLPIAIVTKPFPFEGGKQHKIAKDGLVELQKHVNSLIVVSNDNLLANLPKMVTLLEVVQAANAAVKNCIQSIVEDFINTGTINVDV